MNDNNSGGVGCIGIVQIVFIILKLTDLIHWTWFWVLSPTWIVLLLVGFVLLVAGIVAMVSGGHK
jgi:hypothetical protein